MLYKNNTYKTILILIISLTVCFCFYSFLNCLDNNSELYENYNIYDLNALENDSENTSEDHQEPKKVLDNNKLSS